MAKKAEMDWTFAVLGASAFFLFVRLRKEAETTAPKTSLGFDEAQQWAYDKAHGGTRWGPRSMGGGYSTFGLEGSRVPPSNVEWREANGGWEWATGKPLEQDAGGYVTALEVWLRAPNGKIHYRRGRLPGGGIPASVFITWKTRTIALPLSRYGTPTTTFGQDVVPHLCETQWAESDARCAQHLGDPTFGSSLLREETAELSQYFSAFGSKSRG